jgi:histidyl-tRNA synthetase
MPSIQPYKGSRDFYPEDKRVQKYIFKTIRQVVESFGYVEYDAPIIEPIDIYLSKTSEEIVTEQTYNFLDRGGRHITLRPEMTPSVSRMVAARRQELSYPLRWYSIVNLWRYERPQHGRLREHYQLNADLFGISGIEGDHEIILLADSILKAFRAKTEMYEIRLNSRTLINWILLEYLRLDAMQGLAMSRLIDRKDKMSQSEFIEAAKGLLNTTQLETDLLQKLSAILSVKNLQELPLDIQQHPSVNELKSIMELLKASGASNCIFSPSLMRGFDYYTNIVFEVFDKHPENNRSMFGGGRYDGYIQEFGVEPLPVIGFGMGDVTLLNFLQGHELLPRISTETDATAILVGDVYAEAQETISNFRKEGLRLAVDTSQRKMDSRIKAAHKGGIPYVIFIGPDELKSKRFKVKRLTDGKEQEISFERAVSAIAPRHAPAEDL